MTGESHIGKVENPQTRETAVGNHDGLQAFRMADHREGNTLAGLTNTADRHLAPVQLQMDTVQTRTDVPYNPKHYAGTYDKADIDTAKQHFGNAQVRALEASGPGNFHQMMDAVRKAPPAISEKLVENFKHMADAVIKYEHDNPPKPPVAKSR